MIPYYPLKEITEKYHCELQEKVAAVVASGVFLSGEETALFEKEYAAYTGTDYCVTCGNGYDALWLIFAAYKKMGVLKDGDEVIVPANTFVPDAEKDASIEELFEQSFSSPLLYPTSPAA